MHGDNACQVDRYQMCALQAVPSSEAWEMIHCNFQYQSCLKVDEATDTSHPNCYKDYIQQFCTESFATSTTHEELSTCQASDESEQWMMDSATATTEATGNVPLWVLIDDVEVSDYSSGTDSWADDVLAAICDAAAAKGLDTPDACA
mmetsp:Transcript_89411/g.255323  ORF Transcript_89411/g.255323 Transcript_89411/m.255323 type:complete len:147 (+) Transcript_89411:338-778(+)